MPIRRRALLLNEPFRLAAACSRDAPSHRYIPAARTVNLLGLSGSIFEILVLVGHVWAALGTAEFAYIVGLSLPVSLSATIDSAFGTLVELHAGALIVSTDPLFTNQRAQVAALAARHAVPAIYVWREFVAAGGLMSYGTDLADVHRQAGIYTGKILKGAKPADLPVEQVVKIELVINLTTAKAARTHNTAGAARPRRRSDRIMS